MKYVTVMFPYPSGDGLHAGHWYNYAITDSYCRYLRYRGEQVFQPFGYDSFGLPAENYARKVGGNPKEITYRNIDKFRNQMNGMNTQFQELLTTSDDIYITRVQWLFNLLLEKGLAYKANGVQDYCGSCETVLAKEQVVNNHCERCGAEIIKKELRQWYFRITDYKDRLIAGLDAIDYPESTKKAQRNWLENLHDWCVSRQRKWGCPIPVDGETDTLDTFVDSSLYTIVYCWRAGIKPIPVDVYVGGKEHSCMHLIYARFITMFLYDQGIIDFQEPFKKVVHQGMILYNGEKMSKSKGNVVNLDNYDSDIIRFYLMFLGDYKDGGSWSDQNIMGIKRFVEKVRLWLSNEHGSDVLDITKLEQQVGHYTERFKFNKVVSSFMIYVNENRKLVPDADSRERFLRLLQVYMPGIKAKI